MRLENEGDVLKLPELGQEESFGQLIMRLE